MVIARGAADASLPPSSECQAAIQPQLARQRETSMGWQTRTCDPSSLPRSSHSLAHPDPLEAAAMPSNLPLELQLLIVELALPPLILSRLDERAELCQTFSLVHRSWTPVAQREIHEHVSCADEASILGLTAGVKGRWPIKRFRLEYLPACRSRFKRLMENALARGNIEQIWVSGRLSPSDHFIEGAHGVFGFLDSMPRRANAAFLQLSTN